MVRGLPTARKCRDRLVESFPELQHVPSHFVVVGGAVRDALLGVPPVDVDLLGERAEWFANAFARQAGGTVVVLGREPMMVWRVVRSGRIFDFSDLQERTIDEDLRRRDYTMNSIGIDFHSARFVDPTGGIGDIGSRTVRMVREANLLDDPLRILKAVRMAVSFAFTIEEQTRLALRRHAELVSSAAPERLMSELNAIFAENGNRGAAALLTDLGLDTRLLDGGLDEEATRALTGLGGGDPLSAWSLIFLRRPEEQLRQFAHRMRWSDAARREVLRTVELLRRLPVEKTTRFPICFYDAGRAASERALDILEALDERRMANRVRRQMEKADDVYDLVPLLKGDEIQALAGIEAGPEVGVMKRRMIELQLEGRIKTPEQARRRIRQWARASKD